MSAIHANNTVHSYMISQEKPDDVAVREALLDIAMGSGRKRKSSEKIRKNRLPAEGLSFVAKSNDGILLGTVRLWHVRACYKNTGMVDALLLGPLAVNPVAEGMGIGSQLMCHAIIEAKRRGHGAILLVGDPEYYARFGFSSLKTDNLAMPGPYEKRRFQAIELIEGHLDGAKGILQPSGYKIKTSPARHMYVA